MKNLLLRFLFFAGCVMYLALLSNTSGAPAGTTGAPGEETCGQSGCHATTPNTGAATISILLDDDATAYTPGEIHTLTVTIDNPQTATRNGFEIVALNSLNNNIGEWLLSGEYLQMKSANGRNYMTHSEDGSILTSWDIVWRAPNTDAGAVTFYAAVNDANDNGNRTGDNIYTIAETYEAQLTSSIKTISSVKDIMVFPNPVQTAINIKFDLITATNLSGTLINATGQSVALLFQQDLPAGVSDLSIPFPSDFPTGPYFLQLENLEGGVKSIALLKE